MDGDGKTSDVLSQSSQSSLSSATESNNSSFNNNDFSKTVLNESNEQIENNMMPRNQIKNDFGEKENNFHRTIYKDPNLLLYKSFEGFWYQKLKINFNDVERDGYFCFGCSKYLLTFDAVKNHINTHRNVQPYVCEKCDRAFHSRLNERRHKCIKQIKNVGLTASNNIVSNNPYFKRRNQK